MYCTENFRNENSCKTPSKALLDKFQDKHNRFSNIYITFYEQWWMNWWNWWWNQIYIKYDYEFYFDIQRKMYVIKLENKWRIICTYFVLFYSCRNVNALKKIVLASVQQLCAGVFLLSNCIRLLIQSLFFLVLVLNSRYLQKIIWRCGCGHNNTIIRNSS